MKLLAGENQLASAMIQAVHFFLLVEKTKYDGGAVAVD
jgi:hypothetical protein